MGKWPCNDNVERCPAAVISIKIIKMCTEYSLHCIETKLSHYMHTYINYTGLRSFKGQICDS